MIKELEAAIETARARSEVYGENYKTHGFVMEAMFPLGVRLVTASDHQRFGVITQLVAKLTRYANQFENGGHVDSAHDMITYSAILEELTKK